jgi:uncharacterized protein YcfL
MKKIIKLMTIIIVVSTFVVTGCGNKKVATIEDFESVVKDAGLTLLESDVDVDEKTLSDIGTAYSTDLDVMAMFYVYTSKDAAIKDYEETMDTINTSSNTTVSMGNYNTFEGTLKDETLSSYDYIYVSRVEDTIFMVISSSDKKDDAKAIAKKLGY